MDENDFEEQIEKSVAFSVEVGAMTADEYIARWRATKWTGQDSARAAALQQALRARWEEDRDSAFYILADFGFDLEGLENHDAYEEVHAQAHRVVVSMVSSARKR